jgi:hypothetical protein
MVTADPKPPSLGLLIVALIAFAVMAGGCAASVKVRVRNDTSVPVRIAGCVDDSQDVGPGETFDAGGVPKHDELMCRVTHGQVLLRCVAIPHVHSIRGTIGLSRFVTVPTARCE